MELVYSTVYLEEVKEKNMEYYYMTMKKNLDGVEVEKIFIWKEGYAFKRNETKFGSKSEAVQKCLFLAN